MSDCLADVLQARPLKKKKTCERGVSRLTLLPCQCCPPPFSFDLSLFCLLTACGLFSPFLVRCLAPRRKPVSYVPLLPIFVAIAWVWRHAAFGWLASCVVRSVDLLPYLCAHSRCQVVPCLFPLALPSWLYNVVAFTRISMQSAMVLTSGHVPAYDDLVLLFSLSACSAFLFLLSPLLLCFVRAEAGFEDSPFTRTGLGPRLAVVGVGGWFGRVFRLGLKSN